MSIQAFNAIAANLRRQFPTLTDAMILAQASQIYQAMLQASIEAARLQAKHQKRIPSAEPENKTDRRRGLFG